jgi:hypothetical protein
MTLDVSVDSRPASLVFDPDVKLLATFAEK